MAFFKNLFNKVLGKDGSGNTNSNKERGFSFSIGDTNAGDESGAANAHRYPVTGNDSDDTTAKPSGPFDALELKDGEIPWLIIGLGNPGAKYEATRHNIGYMAVDQLLDDIAVKNICATFLTPADDVQAQVFSIRLEDQPVIVARANGYMNLSGEAIGRIAKKFNIPADRIVVIHDELDLKPGQVRIKVGGGENGHNGLKSTTEHLGTRDYVRIRMGIGRPSQGIGVVDHVLAPFSEDECETWLPAAVDNAAQGAFLIATQSLAKAQNSVHSK